MHQAVIEVGTNVCRDIQEARADILELRREMISLANANGLLLGAASTHPFADWKAQEIYPDERYRQVVEDMQLVARANLVFGLHVHVGIEDRNTAIHIMNSLRYFLPHILALSTNSPFWMGMETGFKSYRCKVFERFPRTNIPDVFANWAEYETFLNLLIKTNCIDNGKKVWWDIRPHPFFDTLEVRVCDIPMRLDETIAIAALIQATVAMLWKLHAANKSYRIYSRALIMENKFRASRYGLDGKLIDFGKEEEVPMRDLMLEYLDLVNDAVDELGSRDEINYIHEMLEDGNGRRSPAHGFPRDRRPEESCGIHCCRDAGRGVRRGACAPLESSPVPLAKPERTLLDTTIADRPDHHALRSRAYAGRLQRSEYLPADSARAKRSR